MVTWRVPKPDALKILKSLTWFLNLIEKVRKYIKQVKMQISSNSSLKLAIYAI